MAEHPLTNLTRLVSGAAMLPGPLGFKVLGQLLISGSKGAEVAGANVVLAAVSRQSNVAAQVAVRSMVSAVLVEVLSRKEQQRLQRLIEMQKKINRQRTEHDGLMTDVLKLSHQAESSEHDLKALRCLLGDYVPVRTTDAQSPSHAGPAVKVPETKPEMVPEDLPARHDTPDDGDPNPPARKHGKALLKVKQPKKKGKSKGKEKISD